MASSGGDGPNMSLYGSEGNNAEDFPVLKAFQQYIDAEQGKARRRMVTLCAFFGALIVIVVAVFMLRLQSDGQRIQQLNDRMVELAMRERPAQTATNGDAAYRSMTETMLTLQRQMAEQQAAALAMQQRNLQLAALPVQQAQPSADQLERERINRETAENLARAQALLEEERRKVAAEKERLQQEELRRAAAEAAEKARREAADKERLRQEEIERYRRKSYPDYYARLDAEAAARRREENAAAAENEGEAARKPTARKPAPMTDEQIDALIAEANAEEEAERAPLKDSNIPKETRKGTPKKRASAESDAKSEDDILNEDDAIEYFDESEADFSVPVTDEGGTFIGTWRVPVVAAKQKPSSGDTDNNDTDDGNADKK